MDSSYFRYWGKAKKSPEQDGPDYHLLPYHCLDVAAVGFELLNPEKDLCQRLAKSLNVEPEWLQAFFVFCLALHDIGKFARAFQGLAPNLSGALVSADSRCVYMVRHDALGVGFWFLVLTRNLCDVIGRDMMIKLEPWLHVVLGHHGIPVENSRAKGAAQSHSLPEDALAVEQYVRAIISGWMPDLSPLNSIDKKTLRSISWQLAGVAVLADWLGSSQRFFPYLSDEMPLQNYWCDRALPGAQRVLSSTAFLPKSIRPFHAIQDQFSFITAPTPLQNFAQSVPLMTGPQLFILEDVTGAGKTEAGMVLVHRLMSSGFAKGLYVGLPTMATANAMYERLSKSYRALFGDSEPPSIVLAHGASQNSALFQQSVSLSEQFPDRKYQQEDVSASAYCNEWLADNRKKALLADVGVGTIDQALLGVLPARHQSLRLLGLADKVLLVDEVHAFDPYMQRLLESLLQAHAAQGGSAILLSATLPFAYRKRFVEAYAHGRLSEADAQQPEINKGALYPLVTHSNGYELAETPVETRGEVKRTVKVCRLFNEDIALTCIRSAVEQGQCVCWIRNTVRDARNSYQQILDSEWLPENQLTLFHSRYAMIDRQTIEQDVLTRFGKKSTDEQRRGQVLIATQVVEQSLDLDFDVMISDLAPVDLLIQRAGRLQRHVRDNQGNPLTEGYVEQRPPPCLYVLSPDPAKVDDPSWLRGFLPGTRSVYPNVGELWRGINLLEMRRGFSMPEDARMLIEAVYGDEAEAIPEPLERDSLEAFADQKVKRSMGEFNLLKLAMGYSYKSAMHNGGWDEDVNIPTRLGGETVDVVLVRDIDGELLPYAEQGVDRWALSQVKVPVTEWGRANRKLSVEWQRRIGVLKESTPALRWQVIWPWVDGLQDYYSPLIGWRDGDPANAGNG